MAIPYQGILPPKPSRGAIDNYLANIQGQYTAADINEIAQFLSNNSGGVSFQELQGRLAEGVAAPQQSGSGGSSGGGGSSAPAMVRASLQDKIDALNNLYNVITNDINTLTQDRRGQLESNYAEQGGELTKQYEKNQGVLPWSFAARNTRYSSDYENAITDAADTYTKGQSQLQSDKDSKLADLGRTYSGQIAGINSARSGIAGANPNFYGTAADLNATRQSYDQQLNSLSQQRAGLGTDAGYRGQLSAIAPTKVTSTADLQAQLDKITQSSIPGFAKDTIAKGIIKQSGQDDKYWQDYYEKQAGGLSTPIS